MLHYTYATSLHEVYRLWSADWFQGMPFDNKNPQTTAYPEDLGDLFKIKTLKTWV